MSIFKSFELLILYPQNPYNINRMLSEQWQEEDDQDQLFLGQMMQKMEEQRKLCKFIRDLDQNSLKLDCSESSYAVRIRTCDSCRLQETTNDVTLQTQNSYTHELEQSLMLMQKIKSLSKSKTPSRKRNKRMTIEKKATNQPLNGQGITKLANGDVVFAKWQNGTVEGTAKVLQKSGNIYVGDIKDYRRCGSGTYVFKRSSYKYEGEFSDGLFEGKGVLTDDQGSIVKKGIWRKGSLIQPLT